MIRAFSLSYLASKYNMAANSWMELIARGWEAGEMAQKSNLQGEVCRCTYPKGGKFLIHSRGVLFEVCSMLRFVATVVELLHKYS